MVLIFIDARVKINDAYYCEVFLTQKLLPVMQEICGEFFIFQQGNVLLTERVGQSTF